MLESQKYDSKLVLRSINSFKKKRVKRLVEHGVDHETTQWRYQNLKRGINSINHADNNSDTAAIYAARKGYDEILSLLVSSRADLGALILILEARLSRASKTFKMLKAF